MYPNHITKTHSDGVASWNSTRRPFNLVVLRGTLLGKSSSTVYAISPGTSCIVTWFEICVLQKVCECVLRRGALTLANIIRFTELTRENVINCLRLLIHQNCVQAFTIQQEGILLCINLIGISDCTCRYYFITSIQVCPLMN